MESVLDSPRSPSTINKKTFSGRGSSVVNFYLKVKRACRNTNVEPQIYTNLKVLISNLYMDEEEIFTPNRTPKSNDNINI